MNMKFTFIRRLRIGTSFVVFLLFFGLSALEAFRTRNWIGSVFWVIIAILFLIADSITKEKNGDEQAV